MLLEDYLDAVGMIVGMKRVYPPEKWVAEYRQAADEASFEALGPV